MNFEVTTKIEPDLEKARLHSSRHRKEIERSETCGCFYCLTRFRSKLAHRWLDEETTAVCPNCGIDAVIGAASGIDIRKPFLLRMKRYWFGGADEDLK